MPERPSGKRVYQTKYVQRVVQTPAPAFGGGIPAVRVDAVSSADYAQLPPRRTEAETTGYTEYVTVHSEIKEETGVGSVPRLPQHDTMEARSRMSTQMV
jgi:hypothetical protein